LRTHAGHPSTIADIAWRPASRHLTAACYGGLHHYSLDYPERMGADEWAGSTLVIAWSPDARYVATGDQDATVHFWFARTGDDLMMSGYATKVRELAWDPTSRYLATGGSDTVVLWDCSGKGPEGRRPIELKGHEHFVSALAWQCHGGVLASAGRDGRVVLWRPARDRRQLARATFASTPTVLAWSPDDRWLAIACDGGDITVVPSL
jgi:WD40 repeat protein